MSLAYAIYLPNDRAFVAKLVLIRTISSALNSVTHFMSQYNRYCNQYLKYRKHFDQTNLSYDEHHEALPISDQFLQITHVSIQRGQNYSIQGGEIPIRLGKHILVQGPFLILLCKIKNVAIINLQSKFIWTIWSREDVISRCIPWLYSWS